MTVDELKDRARKKILNTYAVWCDVADNNEMALRFRADFFAQRDLYEAMFTDESIVFNNGEVVFERITI